MLDDRFKDVADSLTSPARDCFAISGDDNADLPQATKAIYVGEGGDIVLRAVGSQTDVTLTNVPSGAILPIRLRAMRVTGTSASNIIGLA